MHHRIIDRSTDAPRERLSIGIGAALEGGLCPIIPYKRLGERIELARGHARGNDLGDLRQSLAHQQIGLAHQLYLVFCLERYHY